MEGVGNGHGWGIGPKRMPGALMLPAHLQIRTKIIHTPKKHGTAGI